MSHTRDYIVTGQTPTYHIFGGGGLLGSALSQVCKETGKKHKRYSRSGKDCIKLDITRCEDILQFVNAKQNDFIVNLAAIAHPSEVYRYRRYAELINVGGNTNLVNYARMVGCKYFFMSSVEVFDGTKDTVDENTATSPLNEYGRQKVACEEYILDNMAERFVIGRTSWNISRYGHGRCFITFMINALDREGARMAVDNIFTIGDSRETAVNIIRALESEFEGILHIASPSPISRYEAAEIIMRYYRLSNLSCTPCRFDDILFDEKRSRINVLDTHKSIVALGAVYSDPRSLILSRVLELNRNNTGLI